MLDVINVTKTFNPGTVNESRALDGVSLHLERGDFVTVIGSNGAGKSTLFNLIGGTYFADGGKILLDGEDITYRPEHRRSKYIGRMFQDPMKGTAPHLSIEENLALAFLRASEHMSPFSRVTKKERESFRERLAELGLGLEDRMRSPVGLLSGGQRQALTLLMATVVTPKLLMLDEHTAALDPATAEKVLALTRRIVSGQRITCLMVTHNIASALSLGSRTVMMNGGKIVLSLEGKERDGMSVTDLMALFKQKTAQSFDNDRMLL